MPEMKSRTDIVANAVHELRNYGDRSKRTSAHYGTFISIGLYIGTCAAAIASAAPHRQEGKSFVDKSSGRRFWLTTR